jgi:DNA-binding transcriptional LysR family regulator
VEDDFGVALVRRMARGPSLTEQGRAIANVAAPHVAALRDVSSNLTSDRAEIYGRLRITAPSDLGVFILGPLVPQFLAQHPRVRIDVDLSLRVVDLVTEGFDFAIRVAPGGSLPSSTLMAKRLARLDLGLYASPTYAAQHGLPKRHEELAHHDNMLFPGVAARGALSLLGPKGAVKVTIDGRIVANDFFFVREAVLAGAAIGPLPWYLASPELAARRLVRVLPEYRLNGGACYLVHPPAKPMPQKVAAFRSFLLERAPRVLIAP